MESTAQNWKCTAPKQVACNGCPPIWPYCTHSGQVHATPHLQCSLCSSHQALAAAQHTHSHDSINNLGTAALHMGNAWLCVCVWVISLVAGCILVRVASSGSISGGSWGGCAALDELILLLHTRAKPNTHAAHQECMRQRSAIQHTVLHPMQV